MPIYEYACSKCEKITDVLQKVDDPAPPKCSHCGAKGTLHKVVSRTSFVLKGGGWYSDLYGSTKKDPGSGSSGSKDSTDSSPKAEKSSAPTEKPAAAKPEKDKSKGKKAKSKAAAG